MVRSSFTPWTKLRFSIPRFSTQFLCAFVWTYSLSNRPTRTKTVEITSCTLLTPSVAFTAPIFTKVQNTQQLNVDFSSTKFQPNLSTNTECIVTALLRFSVKYVTEPFFTNITLAGQPFFLKRSYIESHENRTDCSVADTRPESHTNGRVVHIKGFSTW